MTFGPGSLRNDCDLFHFRSFHPGGANFLCADGSVHFLSYSAASVLPALGTRAGGEVADLPYGSENRATDFAPAAQAHTLEGGITGRGQGQGRGIGRPRVIDGRFQGITGRCFGHVYSVDRFASSST